MLNQKVIGIDFGATNIRAGICTGANLSAYQSGLIKKDAEVDEVMDILFTITDAMIATDVTAIGIGVAGIVDTDNGIVYDIINIPSCKKIALKKIMEDRYQLPVFVDNDANCFALGEHYFGKGNGHKNMIGLTIGTGLGAGIIINGHLFSGANGGAGEFGMVPYLNNVFEYYASGQFFENVYKINGLTVFDGAKNGDPVSLKMFAEMGSHLGNAIKMIMYTYDVPLIIIGGSVQNAYPFFKDTMWKEIKTFAFSKSVDKLVIEISQLKNAGIFGAAGLYYDRI